jgi:hypothetical protein
MSVTLVLRRITSLVLDSIPQRKPEHSSFDSSLSDFKLVDQPCRECPRLGSVCHATHPNLMVLMPTNDIELIFLFLFVLSLSFNYHSYCQIHNGNSIRSKLHNYKTYNFIHDPIHELAIVIEQL